MLGDRKKSQIDRTVSLEIVRVTEAAARAAAKWQGKNNKIAADGAAVNAMRNAMNNLNLDGIIVIGEGEKDEAPMLYLGERIGSDKGRKNGFQVDFAVDPIDGTTLTAKGREGAISVLAIAERGNFLNIPDVHYMDKIAVGPGMDISEYNLDMSAGEVAKIAARQLGKKIEDVVVCILDRPRHHAHMESVAEAGARMKLISDGDVAGAIAAAMPNSGEDILIGTGGAPEGVITAAALRCLGGDMLGRLKIDSEEMRQKTIARGVTEHDKIYTAKDLAKGEVMFAATGITNGDLLKGVNSHKMGEITHSVVMRSETKTIRFVETIHQN